MTVFELFMLESLSKFKEVVSPIILNWKIPTLTLQEQTPTFYPCPPWTCESQHESGSSWQRLCKKLSLNRRLLLRITIIIIINSET